MHSSHYGHFQRRNQAKSQLYKNICNKKIDQSLRIIWKKKSSVIKIRSSVGNERGPESEEEEEARRERVEDDLYLTLLCLFLSKAFLREKRREEEEEKEENDRVLLLSCEAETEANGGCGATSICGGSF